MRYLTSYSTGANPKLVPDLATDLGTMSAAGKVKARVAAPEAKIAL